jgi:hypothetical protein
MFRSCSFALCIGVALLFAALPLHAQILYTDLEPDEVVKAPDNPPFKEYSLDINKDGKPDFKLEHFAPDPSFTAVEIYSWPDDPVEAILCDTHNGRPSALTEGFQITPAISSKQFMNTYTGSANSALFINNASSLTEDWDVGEDRYLGVLIELNGNWHVGWIRLNMPADASEFTIKDYAVQLTPNTWIEAGDKGATAVVNPDDPAVRAEIYSTGSAIIVNLPNMAQDATLDVYNILGAHAGQFALASPVNRIPMQNAVPGTYVAVVRAGQSFTTRVLSVW